MWLKKLLSSFLQLIWNRTLIVLCVRINHTISNRKWPSLACTFTLEGISKDLERHLKLLEGASKFHTNTRMVARLGELRHTRTHTCTHTPTHPEKNQVGDAQKYQVSLIESIYVSSSEARFYIILVKTLLKSSRILILPYIAMKKPSSRDTEKFTQHHITRNWQIKSQNLESIDSKPEKFFPLFWRLYFPSWSTNMLTIKT